MHGSERRLTPDASSAAPLLDAPCFCVVHCRFEHLLSPLVAEACIDVCPKNPHNFNVDNVRVVKIQGASLQASSVIKGMVLKRDTEGTVKSVENAKIAAYTQGVDTASTDTKGTVLIKNAEELQNYAKCVWGLCGAARARVHGRLL